MSGTRASTPREDAHRQPSGAALGGGCAGSDRFVGEPPATQAATATMPATVAAASGRPRSGGYDGAGRCERAPRPRSPGLHRHRPPRHLHPY